MIESILEEPLALARHRMAPLVKEREEFLSLLLRQGTSPRRVRSIAPYLIHAVRLLKLTNLRDVKVDESRRPPSAGLTTEDHSAERRRENQQRPVSLGRPQSGCGSTVD
jgi:hypothetical protein